MNFLRVKALELAIVDVWPTYDPMAVAAAGLFDKPVFKQNNASLRTRIISCRSGNQLPRKMLQLVQNFYELSITSITNIPMKEELNANSSANYDVEILHCKSLHDQLKMSGMLRNCLTTRRDGEHQQQVVSLKWSNPKTNITGSYNSSHSLN